MIAVWNGELCVPNGVYIDIYSCGSRRQNVSPADGLEGSAFETLSSALLILKSLSDVVSCLVLLHPNQTLYRGVGSRDLTYPNTNNDISVNTTEADEKPAKTYSLDCNISQAAISTSLSYLTSLTTPDGRTIPR